MKKRFSKPGRGKRPGRLTLRITALFEGAKGLLVLLVGCGALSYIHKDLHAAAGELVRLFHFNPASHYPHVFIDLSARVNDANLWAIVAGPNGSASSLVRSIFRWKFSN
jgi:hypothetical protein